MAFSFQETHLSADPKLLLVPPATYVTTEGEGPPGTRAFQDRVDAVMLVAKAIADAAPPVSFEVEALETQWWSQGNRPLQEAAPEEWRWRHMVRVPDQVDGEILRVGRKAAFQRGLEAVLARRVHLDRIHEGKVVQALHEGAYEELGRTYERIWALMEEKGLEQDGLRHEIYLNDPTEVATDQLATICRIPVRTQ